MPGELDAKNKACVTKSLCKTLREFIEKSTILGFGFGIPCYVAGTAMFCACYACCCCRPVGAEDETWDQGAPPPAAAETTTTGMTRMWDRGLFSWFATRMLACLAFSSHRDENSSVSYGSDPDVFDFLLAFCLTFCCFCEFRGAVCFSTSSTHVSR